MNNETEKQNENGGNHWINPLKRLQKRESPGFGIKAAIITLLLFLFLIPLGMIEDLIWEREGRKDEAEQNIVSSWGGETAFGGPVLVIPRRITTDVLDEKGKYLRTEESRGSVYLLPRNLVIEGRSRSEIKSRGIFDVPVFTMELAGSGEFSLESIFRNDNPEDLFWDQAYVQFSYSHLKGMKKTAPLFWNGREVGFEPGDSALSFYDSVLKVPVDIGRGRSADRSRTFPFRFSQEIRGGKSAVFLPLGGETRVTLASDWDSPSYQGYYLPTEHTREDEGFTAQWEINALSRSIPETWTESESWILEEMREASFGVSFFPELDSYNKTRRTVDYGILFLILPFLTLFLFELIRKVKIHPFQYFLAGAADIMFYLILLSLSEHISFINSYLIASAAVTLLITVYALSIQGVGRKGLSLLPVMAGGYGYLYFVLKSDDYALLMGTAGLFAALAATMFLTRGIRWYTSED